MCKKLEAVAEEYHVTFAIENVHSGAATQVLHNAYGELNHQYFGVCYDVTHEQIEGPNEYRMADTYGANVIAVHISDRVKAFVDHMIPGEGFIDFDAFSSSLIRNRYKGSILMAVMTTHSKYKNPKELLSAAYESAMRIESDLSRP